MLGHMPSHLHTLLGERLISRRSALRARKYAARSRICGLAVVAFAQIALQNLSIHKIAIGAIRGIEVLFFGNRRGICHVFTIVR